MNETANNPKGKDNMQAITTKIIPATNTKPTRIKAECARGSVTISTDSIDYNGQESMHHIAARHLTDIFCNQDAPSTPIDKNPWNAPFVTGQIKSGDYVHVFTK